MPQRPSLHSERLVLRPFVLQDAADVQRLAGERAIADTTASIAHPYPDGAAERWIATHQERFDAGLLVNFAVALRATDELIGAISLMNISTVHERAEVGYWIGTPYWNRGYGTEAAREVMNYGFTVLRLNRLHTTALKRNPASIRIFEKLGMTYEGCLRSHDKKWDRLEDIVLYGILRSEWRNG